MPALSRQLKDAGRGAQGSAPTAKARRPRRVRIEDTYRLSVRDLLAAGLIIPGRQTDFAAGDRRCLAALGYTAGELTVYRPGRGGPFRRHEEDAYTIRLETTPCRFGGRRWWLLCPETGRRALYLYQAPGARRFVHRTALRPPAIYYTQRADFTDRKMCRQRKLRQRHGLGDDLTRLVSKPRRMHVRTFARLLYEDLQLGAAWASADIGALGLDEDGRPNHLTERTAPDSITEARSTTP